jgi:coniferyl-aldehyde dehydrogenase
MDIAPNQQIALSPCPINPTERLFPPYLITEQGDCDLHLTEIFGPILPIITYEDTAKAAQYLQQQDSPLALYIFSENTKEQQWASQQIAAGGVCINETLLHVAHHNLPFGGIGSSGMGAYHGKTGFERFSHLKPVLKQRKPNAMALLLPPYRHRFRRLLSFLLRQ